MGKMRNIRQKYKMFIMPRKITKHLLSCYFKLKVFRSKKENYRERIKTKKTKCKSKSYHKMNIEKRGICNLNCCTIYE